MIPVADRLRARFGIGRICIVAYRGMISKETIEALEQDRRGWQSSWGPGCGPRARSGTRCSPGPVGIGSCIPSAMQPRAFTLGCKEVYVEGRRYIVWSQRGPGPQGRGRSRGDSALP